MTLNARHAVLALLLDLMMGIIQLEKNVTSAGHGRRRRPAEVFIWFLYRNKLGDLWATEIAGLLLLTVRPADHLFSVLIGSFELSSLSLWLLRLHWVEPGQPSLSPHTGDISCSHSLTGWLRVEITVQTWNTSFSNSKRETGWICRGETEGIMVLTDQTDGTQSGDIS